MENKQTTNGETTMQLTYRGQTYTSSNTPSATSQVFTYRSQSYQTSGQIAVTPKAKLSYRGIPYIQPESTLLNGLTPAFN